MKVRTRGKAASAVAATGITALSLAGAGVLSANAYADIVQQDDTTQSSSASSSSDQYSQQYSQGSQSTQSGSTESDSSQSGSYSNSQQYVQAPTTRGGQTIGRSSGS